MLSTVRGAQYLGGYHDACGGILGTMRDVHYRGEII